MAGLLAGAILRDQCSGIIEAQPELPHNHSALLRFRSSIVGDALNIPFRRVAVMKAIPWSLGNPIADALSYSLKTTGVASLRSIVTANGEISERYIAPDNLVEQMATKVSAPIYFDHEYIPNATEVTKRIEPPMPALISKDTPVISTMPMPALMKLLDYPNAPQFKSTIGYTLSIHLKNVDVCATLYYPSRTVTRYRASITGDKLTIEYAFPGLDPDRSAELMINLESEDNAYSECRDVLADFGLPLTLLTDKPKLALQRYGKIVPIDEGVRKRFMIWASDNHNIYSLGRFATWRPGLLLDDLVNDIRVIQRIASSGDSYEQRRK